MDYMSNKMDDLISSGLNKMEYYQSLEDSFKDSITHIKALCSIIKEYNISQEECEVVEIIICFLKQHGHDSCDHDFTELNEDDDICTKCGFKKQLKLENSEKQIHGISGSCIEKCEKYPDCKPCGLEHNKIITNPITPKDI